MGLNVNWALEPLFDLADVIRQAQAEGLRLLGYGPAQCKYQVIASGPLWSLRQYSAPGSGPSVLIVAAPIKRPYIWDLSPSVSAIRYCLRHGLRIYLLEWTPATRPHVGCGLTEFADDAISEAIAAASMEDPASKPFLMGHSLGGTLAAIFTALHPEQLKGLVLLSSPLCFAPGISSFRDALDGLAPFWLPDMDIIPGSALSQLCTTASPDTFIWSRLLDATVTATDSRASDIRPRIERWALDEAPLSGKLIHDIFFWLFRENRLCNGTLALRGQSVLPSRIRSPTLAVANVKDEIAPPASVRPFLELMSDADTHLIEYPGETGVVLQHLGLLVGQDAFAQIWPDIVSWVKDHDRATTNIGTD
jgi:polyhydroxyalkanoate synthase